MDKNKTPTVILEGAISVASAVRARPSKVKRIILRSGAKPKNAEKILNLAKKHAIAVEYLDAEGFTALSAGRTGGGIAAECGERDFFTPASLLSELINSGKQRLAVAAIEGLEDPYNLGYAVRALYTQGVDGLLIPDRDLSTSAAVAERASTGCFSAMKIAKFGAGANGKRSLVNTFKSAGFTVYAADLKKGALEMGDFEFAGRSLVIIGGEKRGISKVFLENADFFIKIPYAAPFSHSLAAQTAATVIAYEINRQRRKNKTEIKSGKKI